MRDVLEIELEKDVIKVEIIVKANIMTRSSSRLNAIYRSTNKSGGVLA